MLTTGVARKRYEADRKRILNKAPANAGENKCFFMLFCLTFFFSRNLTLATDFDAQMAKLAHAIWSGEYAPAPLSDEEKESQKELIGELPYRVSLKFCFFLYIFLPFFFLKKLAEWYCTENVESGGCQRSSRICFKQTTRCSSVLFLLF